ncbi:MAG: hypothetical protein HW403_634 [Dehalococcoidia bacterium]|nr:hypothetical protein [Dehalococcoidia bacterium]
MDFELHYTHEQEEFRKEVREWLGANVPSDLKSPVNTGDLKENSEERYWKAREFRRKLGEKGWLAPVFPKEYGGGGMNVSQAMVLEEELASHDLPGTALGDLGLNLAAPAMMVWGTDEQKRRFLPPILKGEVATWQVFTEPNAGSDLASMQTTAIREGDEFVFNGSKHFVGSPHDVDFLYTLAVTDPAAPRHQNIGAFLVPANTAGVTLGYMDLVAGGGKRTVFYDNARVPASQLIGGERDGWKVAQSTLELEHGGRGALIDKDKYMEKLLEYCRTTEYGEEPISSDPEYQEYLLQAYLGYQVNRLLGLRNYWMRGAHKRFSYEGSQGSMNRKIFGPKLAEIMLKTVGPRVLLHKDESKWSIDEGRLESFQREAIVIPHPGGTLEVQKLIIARRLGVSRTREEGKDYF